MQKIFPIKFEEAEFEPLDTVPNPKECTKLVQIIDPEFSSVCPKTGLPDYGRVILRYLPSEKCIELKAWKLYLRSFYGVGCFHETVTQKVAEDFVNAVQPTWMRVTIDWGARGGLHTTTEMTWDASARCFVSDPEDFGGEVFRGHAKDWNNS